MSSFLTYSLPKQHSGAIFYNPHQKFPLSSPLRSSNNANIMRNGSSPLSKPTTLTSDENSEQPEDTPFAFSLAAPSSSTRFSFQQRARDASSTAQISSRINSNREGRKSAFINRLRQSRRDERDTRGLESFEKAEYLREKRAREEKLRQEAEMLGMQEALEGGYDVSEADGEVSPTEEREMEELVGMWEQQQGDQDVDFEFDDYDEVFMEVLSQQNQAQTSDPPQKAREDVEMELT